MSKWENFDFPIDRREKLAYYHSAMTPSGTTDTSFEDLGADSLDIVEMTMAVEEEFGLEDMDEEDLSGISTVADLVRYLKSKLED